MYPSVLITRCGSAKDAGLFLLEGGMETFDITPTAIKSVAETREGFAPNAEGIVFREDETWKPMWLNECDYFRTRPGDFIVDFDRDAPHGLVEDLAIREDSYLLRLAMEKLAAKKYVSEIFGIMPPSRLLKAVLRHDMVGTKRTVLFGLGVPPKQGGATWLISPYGFPWVKDGSKYIVDSGVKTDLKNVTEKDNFLFTAITNAVPFFSGHLNRNSDEAHPRLLKLEAAVNTEDDDWESYIENLAIIDSHTALTEAMKVLSKLVTAAKGGSSEPVTTAKRDIVDSLDGAVDMGSLDELF